MKTKNLIYAISLSVFILIIWIGAETFTQPGVGDLRGDFVEVAKFRNENNTGPVRRIYAVAVQQKLWHEMEKYGGLMPHTKYGNTKVFFFDKINNTPKNLRLDPPYFDAAFQEFCLGKYEKSAMGEVVFIKYPFKDLPEKALVEGGQSGRNLEGVKELEL